MTCRDCGALVAPRGGPASPPSPPENLLRRQPDSCLRETSGTSLQSSKGTQGTDCTHVPTPLVNDPRSSEPAQKVPDVPPVAKSATISMALTGDPVSQDVPQEAVSRWQDAK